MKDAITIKLGGYKAPAFKYEVPYWFTVDGSIHLSQPGNTKLTINIEDLVFEHAVEIRSAIIRGELVIDSTQILDKFLEEKLQRPVNKTIPKQIPKYNKPEPVVSDLSIKVKKMLTLSIAKLKSQVGTGLIKKGVITKGINEPEILECLLAGENKKKDTRKKAIELITKRLNALSKVNIVIEQAEPMIVTEEDVAEISINSKTGLISTISTEEEFKENKDKEEDKEEDIKEDEKESTDEKESE